jgi:hypothetical protein
MSQHSPGITNHNGKQLVLGRGHRYRPAPHSHLTSHQVHDKIAGNEIRLLALCLKAVPECGSHPALATLYPQRLCYIIIRTEIEGSDLRALIMRDREHDDRYQRLVPRKQRLMLCGD